MLLDILSNGNRPWLVAPHINALFQGVKELGLSGEPKATVEKMISNEGEVLDLKCKGALKLSGKVAPASAHLRLTLPLPHVLAPTHSRTLGRSRCTWASL